MKKKFINTTIILILIIQILVPIIFKNEIFASETRTVIIPKNVTEIKKDEYSDVTPDEAYSYTPVKSGIISLSFEEPSSVKKIGENAFAGNYIEEVKIPDSVEEIGEKAFTYNPLKKLELGKSVKYIRNAAFSCTYIQSVEIPDSVEIIEGKAFDTVNWRKTVSEDSTLIKSITLGKSLKTVGTFAFDGHACDEIEIPESVKQIYPSSFERHKCKNGTPYSVTVYSKDVVYVKGSRKNNSVFCDENSDIAKADLTLYGYAGSTTETYAKENGLKFEEIKDVETAKYTVRHIYLEGQTPHLLDTEEKTGKVGKEVTAKAKEIKGYEYDEEQSQKSKTGKITKDGNLVLTIYYKLPEFQIDSDGGLTVNTKKTELTIPSKINDIPVIRLKKINNLDGQKITKIVLEDNITALDEGSLKNLGIVETNLPSSLLEIGNNAFEGNDFGLVKISDRVKTIGDYAFANCKNLKSVAIYNKTITIGKDAFSNASSDFVIYCYSNSTAETYAISNNIKYVLLDLSNFIWGEDNYNFPNDGRWFNFNEYGLSTGNYLKSRMTNTLYDYLMGTVFYKNIDGTDYEITWNRT